MEAILSTDLPKQRTARGFVAINIDIGTLVKSADEQNTLINVDDRDPPDTLFG